MKILVTGGCGYTGTLLVPALLEQGHEVKVVDIGWFGNHLAAHPKLEVDYGRDILSLTEKDFRGCEAVIHLANVANDPCGEIDSKLSWEVNALGAMQLAEAAIKAGTKQFIFASSGSVYGVKEEPEVTEELSLVPISDYNKTKMIAERVLLSYADKIGVQIVRPATVCGYSPRMRLDVSVNMLTMQAVKNGKITVFGGNQTRPNIHIRDLIGVYLHLLKNPKLTGVFNAGFENITILEIAERAKKRVGAEIAVSASNDPRSYRLSSKKLLNTGFAPRYTVDNAIEEIVGKMKDGVLVDKPEHYNIKMMQKWMETRDGKRS